MWDLIVSVPDHCLSFYFVFDFIWVGHRRCIGTDDGCMFIARQRKPQCHKAVIDAFWKS